MFNKRYIIYILILLIAGICMMSVASATDDITDTVAIDDANTDDISTSFEDDLEKNNEQPITNEIMASEDDSKLSLDESGVAVSSVSGDQYKIDLKKEYEISAKEQGDIEYRRVPCTDESYDAYHFFMCVFDSKLNLLYKKEVKPNPTSPNRNNGTFTHHIDKNSLAPGTYIIKAINYDDGKVMDTGSLKVKGEAAFTGSDYNSNYLSDAKMTVTLKDKTSGKLITTSNVQVIFTKGKTSITKYYKTNSKGQISFVPPLSKGVWVVKISPTESYIGGSVVKLAVIKKSSVVLKAKNVVEYKGHKMTLKATVKTKKGKKISEGKVEFKINGKKYYGKVKNGVATAKVSLKKLKKYDYTAKYLGTGNLYKSKVSKAKATMKQSYATKVYPKDKKLKTKKALKFSVKTTAGKNVKNGKLKIKLKKTFWVKVKKGKATFNLKKFMKNAYQNKKGTLKVNYVPATHLYKSSKATYKLTR